MRSRSRAALAAGALLVPLAVGIALLYLWLKEDGGPVLKKETAVLEVRAISAGGPPGIPTPAGE